MVYKQLIRPLIRRQDKEKARKYVFGTFRIVASFSLGRQIIRWLYKRDHPSLYRMVFGLDMPNPIGLAAGFDPNARMCDMLLDGGFAYVQAGPFYDKKQILSAIANLKERKHYGIVAANLSSKAPGIMTEDVAKAYDSAFSLLYDFVDMFVLNVGDPDMDLDAILNKRTCMDVYKPVLLHFPEDISPEDADDLLRYCMLSGIDGVIVGNSLYDKTLASVKYVMEKTGGRLPVVASGGIFTPNQAKELLEAGASMIELFDGLIKEGPSLTRKILNYLAK